MLEKAIEKFLTGEVKAHGGLALKFVSPNFGGVPDRIILLDGKAYFVELKTKDGRLSEIQKAVHKKFEKLGFPVDVLRSKVDAVQWLEKLNGRG